MKVKFEISNPKPQTHFETHFIQHINYVLVILRARTRLTTETVLQIPYLHTKILKPVHSLHRLQPVHDLRLYLCPLLFVTGKQNLHFADNLAFTRMILLVLLMKLLLHVSQEIVRLPQLFVKLLNFVFQGSEHILLLLVVLLLDPGQALIDLAHTVLQFLELALHFHF